MVVAQVLGSDHAMKICFEKFLDEVDCFVSTAKTREGEKLVMEKEWIRWRRRGKRRDMPSLKVS